jgi:hypothetical protein
MGVVDDAGKAHRSTSARIVAALQMACILHPGVILSAAFVPNPFPHGDWERGTQDGSRRRLLGRIAAICGVAHVREPDS